jgi:hypothetical protein
MVTILHALVAVLGALACLAIVLGGFMFYESSTQREDVAGEFASQIGCLALLVGIVLGLAAFGIRYMLDDPHQPVGVQALAGVAMTRFPTAFGEFKAEVSVWPPDEYKGDNAAVVIFTDVAGVQSICHDAAEPGKAIVGCSGIKDGTPIIVLPNPCGMRPEDFYAGISCHELAHVNGWRHPGTPPPKPQSHEQHIDTLSIAWRR